MQRNGNLWFNSVLLYLRKALHDPVRLYGDIFPLWSSSDASESLVWWVECCDGRVRTDMRVYFRLAVSATVFPG